MGSFFRYHFSFSSVGHWRGWDRSLIGSIILFAGLGHVIVIDQTDSFPLLIAIALSILLVATGAKIPPLIDIGFDRLGMGPMATSVLLAISYNLQPRLAGLMLAVGIPLSFLTLAGWYQFLTT